MYSGGPSVQQNGSCSPVRRTEMDFVDASSAGLKMLPTSEEKLENAMSLLRKTMEFLKSEYEMDTVVLTSFSPKSTSHCPFPGGGTQQQQQQQHPSGHPSGHPSAGYHSSSGVAADFLHTPAGRHVITCWHQYCQGNAIFMSATASSSLKYSYSEPETAAVSFNLPIQLRPTSVSPCSSVESGESLDSNENMIHTSGSSLAQCRKRPRNFLVNSLMTATNQLGRKRRASLSQSDSLKCSESPSPIVTPSEFANVTQSEHDLMKEDSKNAECPDTSQVLDLSTNNTPTTPPPELEHPSDAFGLLAAIKEEQQQNLISPEKFRSSRGVKEDPSSYTGSDSGSFLTGSPPATESLAANGLDTPKARSRDELKSFIRAYGPIKKRSASLSSDADFAHRYSSLASVPSSLAEEADFDSSALDCVSGDSKSSSRCSAGTLLTSTGSTTDSDSLWSCPKCKKVMKKKCSYRHVKEVHGQNREIVQCPVCFRSFTRKYTLVLHCRNVHPQLDLAACTELSSSRNGDPETKPDSGKDDLSKKLSSKNSSVPNLSSMRGATGQSSSSSISSVAVGRSQSSEPMVTKDDPSDTFSGQGQVTLESGHNSMVPLSADQSLLGTSASPLMSSMPHLSYLKAQAASLLKQREHNHNSISQEIVRQTLMNPPLNSLELSLRLAQLERTQQRQMQLLASNAEEIHGQDR